MFKMSIKLRPLVHMLESTLPCSCTAYAEEDCAVMESVTVVLEDLDFRFLKLECVVAIEATLADALSVTSTVFICISLLCVKMEDMAVQSHRTGAKQDIQETQITEQDGQNQIKKITAEIKIKLGAYRIGREVRYA